MKKKILIGLTAFSLCLMTAIPAMAQTVYYNGTPVSWNHGRKLGVYSYSDVQTGVYDHSATANSDFSGWKSPGILAHAQKFIGTGTVETYWNCR
ncbi:Uncharacterised protein [Clostridium putrefaciens]|uniref:Bacteriocin n=2 Tax=Clostridium putrefaciens TaxID=99675 RepID=A0A381JDJ8_9CLOT|nr:Uncharacterised protein [Clostridium putrefaciens]